MPNLLAPTSSNSPLIMRDSWVDHFRVHNARQQKLDHARKIGGVALGVLSIVGGMGALFPGGALNLAVPFVGIIVGSGGPFVGGYLYHKARARPDLTQPEAAKALLDEMSALNLDKFCEIQTDWTHQLKIRELLQTRLISQETATTLQNITETFGRLGHYDETSDRLKHNYLELKFAQDLRQRFKTILNDEIISPSPLRAIATHTSA